MSIMAPKYIGAGIPAVVQFKISYYFKESANKELLHHLKLSPNVKLQNIIISVAVLITMIRIILFNVKQVPKIIHIGCFTFLGTFKDDHQAMICFHTQMIPVMLPG